MYSHTSLQEVVPWTQYSYSNIAVTLIEQLHISYTIVYYITVKTKQTKNEVGIQAIKSTETRDNDGIAT